MKSPAELSERLRRQWNVADNREELLLSRDVWPVVLSIGKPTADQFTHQTARVREHIERWRAVSVGRVVWQAVRFRSGSEPVDIPLVWQLETPAEWMEAAADPVIHAQFSRFIRMLGQMDSRFHRLLVRQPHLISGRADSEVLKAVDVAAELAPGCAAGRPLRAIQVAGIDSKFLERNRNLVTALLDVLFTGEASERGLENFLGALDDSRHWILVAPLVPNLLPFHQQRVRASELAATALPGSHLLVVENERSLHQLPSLPGTTAVLGAGLNLEWLGAPWLKARHVAYWGDLDTWGLQMLATARVHVPHVVPLLMTKTVFDAYADSAVIEPRPADEQPPAALTIAESELYRTLRGSEKGRLEQEFLPSAVVAAAVQEWHRLHSPLSAANASMMAQ